MSHYAMAHLNDGRYDDTSILSPQGIAELHAPAAPMGADQHYGLGWVVGALDGIPLVGHSGALSNFRTSILLMPETGEAVILLANASGFEQIFQIDELSQQIASMLVGKSPAPVSVPLHVRFLYWTLLLTPLVQFIGIAYGWRHLRNKRIGRLLLTVVLYAGVALLWLFGVPQLTGIPIWPDLHRGYPEMFYGLSMGVVLGFGWSVIYTTMSLRRWRSR
jgi:CubicO group peptidase (beta-lactamase class C family)